MLVFITLTAYSQDTPKTFTQADTLRGTLTPEREWWDVLRYDIIVEPDFQSKTIKGSNKIKYKTLKYNQIHKIPQLIPLMKLLFTTKENLGKLFAHLGTEAGLLRKILYKDPG